MMSKQAIEDINCGDESDHDLISTEMLEDIRDKIHTHLNVNRREARYKYVITLGKCNRNGKECQKVQKAWEKVYTRYLVQL